MLIAEMGGLKANALHSYGVVFFSLDVARLLFWIFKAQHGVATRRHFVNVVFYPWLSDSCIDTLQRLIKVT